MVIFLKMMMKLQQKIIYWSLVIQIIQILMLLEQNLKAHKNIIIYPKEYTFIYNNLF